MENGKWTYSADLQLFRNAELSREKRDLFRDFFTSIFFISFFSVKYCLGLGWLVR